VNHVLSGQIMLAAKTSYGLECSGLHAPRSIYRIGRPLKADHYARIYVVTVYVRAVRAQDFRSSCYTPINVLQSLQLSRSPRSKQIRAFLILPLPCLQPEFVRLAHRSSFPRIAKIRYSRIRFPF